MKATVVVSCYNQIKYIEECINSILNQTVDFEYNIIISDDCSTDGTTEIVKLFQQNYSQKIHLITHEKNVGPAENYLDAHRKATGDIVYHIDGDDVMLPEKLQKQFDVFRNNPSVNLVFHRAIYFSDDGEYRSETGSPNGTNQSIVYFSADELALWGTIAPHSSYAFRRTARHLHHPEKEFMEWYFAMDALLPSGQGAYLNEILLKYRCNQQGSAYLSSKAGRIKAYKIYCRDISYFFNNFPNLRNKLYSNYLTTVLAMIKNGCGFSKPLLFFIFRYFYFFNMSHFKQSINMRRSVAPLKKNR